MRGVSPLACLALLAVRGPTFAAADESGAEDWSGRGSLAGVAALPAGGDGMSVSGGFAVALPFVAFEYGKGVGANVDLGLRFESIVGLLQFAQLGMRWTPLELGAWRLGTRLGVGYSFFGLASDTVNLTSTLYLNTEVVASLQTGSHSALVLGVGAEIDLLELVVLDGEEQTEGMFRFDAALLRFGWRTRLTDTLDVFVMGRIRLPVNVFEVGDEQFVVAPFAEFGGSWSW